MKIESILSLPHGCGIIGWDYLGTLWWIQGREIEKGKVSLSLSIFPWMDKGGYPGVETIHLGDVEKGVSLSKVHSSIRLLIEEWKKEGRCAFPPKIISPKGEIIERE